MHEGKTGYILVWFFITPFIVALFMKMGWGVSSILVAMGIGALLIWIFSRILKTLRRLFPTWGALLHWSMTGKYTSPQDENVEIVGDGWQVGKSPDGDDEDDDEDSDLPSTTALLPSGRGDLHPAIIRSPLPTRPPALPQYAFAFGTLSLDMEILYGTGLIVAPELSKGGIIWTLVRELTRLQVNSLVIDFTGQFDSLPIGNPKGYLLGSPTSSLQGKLQQRHIPVVAAEAGKIGRGLIHHGGQYVFRFHSYTDPREATTTLLHLLQGMYKWGKERIAYDNLPAHCLVLVNQAHQVLPYQDLYSVANADPSLARLLRSHLEYYLNRGGESGMHLYLITDKPTRMAREELERDIWFVQQPQFEELHYLAQSTGFPTDAFKQIRANQALFMDIVNKTSLVVTLPTHTHDPLEDMVLPPVIITQVTNTLVSEEEPSPTYSPRQPLGVDLLQETRQPVPLSASSRIRPVTPSRQPSPQVEVQGEEFPEAWLSWVSFLYSRNRLKPGTVQHPPQDLYEVAEALGLPVGQDKMVNRHRAARMIGYVQGLSPEKRKVYASKVHQVAPQYQRSRVSQGREVKVGPDPPTGWRPPLARVVLDPTHKGNAHLPDEQLEKLRTTIQRTLDEQHVQADVLREDICVGPRVIQFGIRPRRYAEMVTDRKSPGTRVPKTDGQGEIIYTRTQVNDIMPLEPDFALALNELNFFNSKETIRIRMVKHIPGTGCVGLEVPNPVPEPVTFRQVFDSQEFTELVAASVPLPMAMGKDLNGRFLVASLQQEPQRITAGQTGSGKSVAVNGTIASILMLYSPEEVRMLLIDPKQVELRAYAGLPHLLAPVATTLEEAWPLLKRLALEMDRRYSVLARAGVRDLEKYRKERKARPELENLPYLVGIIDEMADLMMQFFNKKEREAFEKLVCRILQKGRAAGIHMQIATQRPSVDVITGLMKANAPAREVYRTASQVDSRVVIDEGGAERLLGRGDGLYLAPNVFTRFQRAMLEDTEIERIVLHWCTQQEAVDAARSSSYATYRLPDLPPEEEDQNREGQREGSMVREPSGAQETVGEHDPLFQKVIEELSVLAESAQVLSINKLRHGKLSVKLPSMKHENAVAIVEALQRAGHLGEYSERRKGYPILVEEPPEATIQDKQEHVASQT